LGYGSTADSNIPVQVSDQGGAGFLTDVEDVSSGQSHTCALLTDGTVWCWGYNAAGALGDGTNTDTPIPVQVLGTGGVGTLINVQSIAAGWAHTCASLTDGTAWCWGHNGKGQLGDGTNNASNSPVQVLGVSSTGTLANVVEIFAGTNRTCARQSGDSLRCWGEQLLGDGSVFDSTTPVQVGLSQVTSATVGHSHCCAILDGGAAAACWGDGDYGQLGNGLWSSYSTNPVSVSSLSGISSISAGFAYTCALISDGTFHCWGRNDYGQLGNPDYFHQPSPVTVLGF